MSEPRLTRSENDRIIAGVCGGIAAYTGIDSVLVRALFVILLFASGIGFPIYLILWFIMPTEGMLGQPGGSILQENIADMGQSVSAGVNRIGQAGVVGGALILFGCYFLLRELGFLSWISGSLLWPLIIIGLGVYLLVRRTQ